MNFYVDISEQLYEKKKKTLNKKKKNQRYGSLFTGYANSCKYLIFRLGNGRNKLFILKPKHRILN